MQTVNKAFRTLGFNIGIPYYVFTKDIGKYTMLVVEGERLRGYRTANGTLVRGSSELKYTFYKARYQKHMNQKQTRYHVYCRQVSIQEVLTRVENYLVRQKEWKYQHIK
ncbi:hypothetical protein [Listeria booriae]|uniref:hypothetical protein n=1 Tax=Listeria booriae TaxID=1552123 RepID=UPI0016298A8E|nr:hypothetical protein [Listeria booriae]